MSEGLPTAGSFRKKRQADLIASVMTTEDPPVVPKSGIDLMVAWSIIGTFIVVLCAVIYTLESILMPVTLAIVVGMVIGLAADRLSRFGVPPVAGGLLLGLLFVGLLFTLVNALVDPMAALAGEAPAMLEHAIERIMPFFERFDWMKSAVSGMNEKQIVDVAMQNAGAMLGFFAAGVTPAFIQTLIFLAALGLFLIGRAHLRKTIIMAFITRERRLTAIHVMNATENAVGFYFATASVIYAVLGVVTTGIAFFGGMSMPPLWGLFAFISSFIPYVGVTAMTIALLCGGLMIQEGFLLAIMPALAFFLLHLVMENLVTPAILGRRLEINPFLIFIAIIFWTWMWGAVGAMLAMPLSLIAMTIFEEVRPRAAEKERYIPG